MNWRDLPPMALPYAEVIGDPVAHSRSPDIHRHWLAALDIAGDYRTAHVTPDDLRAYLAHRRQDPYWRGCNVTVPHKEAVYALLKDRVEAIAKPLGAVNTVFRNGERLGGTNSDVAGVLSGLDRLSLKGRTAVVVGAGGAARAVLAALQARAVSSVTIMNRTQDKGVKLLTDLGLTGSVRSLTSGVPAAAVLINTSSLGMTGMPPLDLDLDPLPDDAAVMDIVYAPLETPLLKAARARGLQTMDGLTMLIGQARPAFERFFGAPPPDGDDDLRRILTS